MTPNKLRFRIGGIEQFRDATDEAAEWVGKAYPLIYQLSRDDLGVRDQPRVLGLATDPYIILRAVMLYKFQPLY